jgi:hypothetical protein
MDRSYDLKKLKKRPVSVKADPRAAKIAISICLDGTDVAALKTEAERLGLPYQTLVGSVLHRYVSGELIDRAVHRAFEDLRRMRGKVDLKINTRALRGK